ncbi:hypothetical protein, partial [Nonomuraea basaltis]|uniref:hypothetical protein n=1 Tax=Nonomuraea basaltis TaxID=2495887 RepID=UPI0019803961
MRIRWVRPSMPGAVQVAVAATAAVPPARTVIVLRASPSALTVRSPTLTASTDGTGDGVITVGVGVGVGVG